MEVLLHPTYFPNIAQCVALTQASHIVFEVCDNYQKQTYRNRTSIYAANGRLNLNVPVIYSQKNRQLYSEVKIFNEEPWQKQHLKSLESAYRMSPFFEFYIDELSPLFDEEFDSIMDLNLKCIDILFECLQLSIPYRQTHNFELHPNGILDARSLVNSRKEIAQGFQPYSQVFEAKHGFITNLSVLDLLFNEGPNAENYLKAQTLILK